MTKYIIELEDDIKYIIINGKADNRCYTLVRSVDELEVLNSDYINEHYGQLQDEAYQAGLNDAWEAARKIAHQWEQDTDTEHRVVIDDSISITLNSMTAKEAIAKLKAYEDKQKDRIEVGDEVVTRGLIQGNTFLATKVTESTVYGISNDGSWNFYNKDSVTKTGKHYDIQSILEAMRT